MTHQLEPALSRRPPDAPQTGQQACLGWSKHKPDWYGDAGDSSPPSSPSRRVDVAVVGDSPSSPRPAALPPPPPLPRPPLCRGEIGRLPLPFDPPPPPPPTPPPAPPLATFSLSAEPGISIRKALATCSRPLRPHFVYVGGWVEESGGGRVPINRRSKALHTIPEETFLQAATCRRTREKARAQERVVEWEQRESCAHTRSVATSPPYPRKSCPGLCDEA